MSDRTSTTEEFSPLPTYSQSIRTNESWAVIITIRTDPDGSTTQRLAIEAKPVTK